MCKEGDDKTSVIDMLARRQGTGGTQGAEHFGGVDYGVLGLNPFQCLVQDVYARESQSSTIDK